MSKTVRPCYRGTMEISLLMHLCALTLQVLDLLSRLFGLLVVTSPLIVEQGCIQSQTITIMFLSVIKCSMIDQDNNI